MADPAPPEPTPTKKKGNSFFSFCAWSLSGLVTLLLVLAIGLAMIAGAPRSAPDWLRDRVTQEVNDRIDTAFIEIGDVSVELTDRLMPRVGLRHVKVLNASQEHVMQIGDVQLTLGLTALLQGQMQPVSAEVAGVQLRVRRFAGGAVGLTIEAGQGDTATAVEDGGVRLGANEVLAQADALLSQPGFQNLTEVTLGNITLRYEDERAGRVWTADGARLSLTRTGDDLRLRGDAALLTGGAYASTIEMNYSRRIGERPSDIGISFEDMPARDIAGQSPALAWLSALEAPISGALRAEIDESGALGPLHATLQIGRGALQPNSGARPVGFNSARTYFTYRPADQEIEFTEVFVDSDWGRAEASGVATLAEMEEGWPSALGVRFDMTQIVTNPNNLYPEPIALERAELEMDLRLDPLRVDLGALRLFDRGEVLAIKGEARAEEAGWQVALAGGVAQITPERLMELWPDTLAPKTHNWITTNVIRSELSDIRFELDAAPGEKLAFFLGFDFADFTARFMRNAPPLEAAHGTASLRDLRFVMTAHGGHITTAQGGRIDVTGTRFVIPKTNVKRTPAEVYLEAAAPIPAALSFLDEPPFGYISRAGLPVDLAEGRAEVAGQLNFRMMDKLTVRDVQFDLAGALEEVRTDKLMEGRVLQAERLTLDVTHEGLQIGGPGRVGDVPFDGKFEKDFRPDPDAATAMGTVRGDVEISQRFLDEFGITLPPGAFAGEGRAAVEIDLARDAPATLRLQSDLEGVAVRIEALNWQMPEATTGLMRVTGRLGRTPDIDLIAIDAPGLRAEGTLSLNDDGALARALFDRVEAQDWLDARVELVGRGRDVPPLVRILDGQVDLTRAQLPQKDGTGRGAPVSVNLDRLKLSETLEITEFRAEIATGQGASGPFSGVLNGKDRITGQMVPQNGRTAFRVRSENAGAFFAAIGLIRQARNGTVDLSLVPGDGAGVWEGTLAARGGMRLKDAPTMAAVLNAATVVGLLEQMGGEGIHFEAVDARFQISPERLTLYSMSATGAALGLSMDGYFYPKSKQMDLQGVISPLYLFNAVGGLFSRQGEGLFGFNFSLRGPTSEPVVSVNPLSALTPGMFRDIFRRPPPERTLSTKDAPDLDEPDVDDASDAQRGLIERAKERHGK